MSTLTQFAKGGGGCFLAGTLISTPNGDKKIEDLKDGDTIYSFNEETRQREESKIGHVDVLKSNEYFVINRSVRATREHPFYTTEGIKKVYELVEGKDSLLKGLSDTEPVVDIERHVHIEEFTIYNLLNVEPNNNYFADGYLVHNKGGGGGHASSGGRAGSSGRSASTSGRSSTSSTTKAGSTVKTSSGKTVKTSSVKPANSTYKNQAGVTGVDGYTPHFRGYNAPAGSVVYYPDHSGWDYLPWIYLFSEHSPANDHATVVQPDGKQVVAAPTDGDDGMAVLNWILLIVIALAVIGGIVWGVNKLTSKGDY